MSPEPVTSKTPSSLKYGSPLYTTLLSYPVPVVVPNGVQSNNSPSQPAAPDTSTTTSSVQEDRRPAQLGHYFDLPSHDDSTIFGRIQNIAGGPRDLAKRQTVYKKRAESAIKKIDSTL